MQLLVMGAGAVGCYFGGLLAKAGHAVTFVGRVDHVEAINVHGLKLETPGFSGYVAARAVTEISGLDPPDLILFCVKSQDTETAGLALAALLKPDTAILSLQNGVDNAERLHAVIGQPVIPAVVYVGAEMAGSGHVKHHGRGELLIGASSQSDTLARMLNDAHIPTTVSADVASALWVKLAANCAYNALSAVANIPYGPMLQVQGAREFMAAVVQECTTVAKAAGVALPDDILAQVLGIAATMPGQFSSTAQDLARNKRSEIDFINGHVVRKGAEYGIPTPANQALQVMVRLAEEARKLHRTGGARP